MAEVLTSQEQQNYTDLIGYFVNAKLAKNYRLSDAARQLLSQWQQGLGDEAFIAMAQSGHYRWHPFFCTLKQERRLNFNIEQELFPMSDFKKGDHVRQKAFIVEGVVNGFAIDQETGDRLVLVDYADADDNDASRYFKESDLEPVSAE